MVRKSEEKDCWEIYALICDMEKKQLPYDEFKKIYWKQLQKAEMYCLIDEEYGKVRGMLNLRFEEQLHHCEKIAEVMEFVVHADYRNRNVGQKMFAEAKRIALEHGCSQIELATNQLRTDAHRFYYREGMHNFHYKLSQRLIGEDSDDNVLGR